MDGIWLEDPRVERMVLLSDSCIPLRSFEETFDAVFAHGTRFTFHSPYHKAWGVPPDAARKIQAQHPELFTRGHAICGRASDVLTPGSAIKHQQFFAMTRADAVLTLAQAEAYQSMRSMQWADEGFFASLENFWRLVGTMPLRPFPGGCEKLWILERRAARRGAGGT